MKSQSMFVLVCACMLTTCFSTAPPLAVAQTLTIRVEQAHRDDRWLSSSCAGLDFNHAAPCSCPPIVGDLFINGESIFPPEVRPMPNTEPPDLCITDGTVGFPGTLWTTAAACPLQSNVVVVQHWMTGICTSAVSGRAYAYSTRGSNLALGTPIPVVMTGGLLLDGSVHVFDVVTIDAWDREARTFTVTLSKRGDANRDGWVSTEDLFTFLDCWFCAAPGADQDANGQTTTQDIFDFLAGWFRGAG